MCDRCITFTFPECTQKNAEKFHDIHHIFPDSPNPEEFRLVGTLLGSLLLHLLFELLTLSTTVVPCLISQEKTGEQTRLSDIVTAYVLQGNATDAT